MPHYFDMPIRKSGTVRIICSGVVFVYALQQMEIVLCWMGITSRLFLSHPVVVQSLHLCPSVGCRLDFFKE